MNAISGMTSFTSVAIDRANSGYKIVATSNGLVMTESSAFNVNGAASLTFLTQPMGKETDEAFGVAIRVDDINGSVFLASDDFITIGIKPFTGASGAALVGIVRALVSNGVATFSGLSISSPGAGFVLVAVTDSGISAESNPFTVSDPPNNEEDNGGTISIFGSIISSHAICVFYLTMKNIDVD